MARSRIGFMSLTMVSLIAGVGAMAQESPPQQAPPSSAPKPEEQEVTVEIQVPNSLTEALLVEIATLKMQLSDTRAQLAQTRLDCDSAQRDLAELRQFVADHQRFGNDFQQYQAVKEAALKDAKARESAAARERRAIEKNQRDSERAAARSAADARNAESNRMGRYKRMGFTPLGLDVFTGKMAFYYNTKEEGGTGALVDYNTIIGRYLQPGFPGQTVIDYSKMTISGSVLNASDTVRNLGVAITFFDESGNQVGHETVEIKNARPDVPYPFTSKIDMALNRAFDSSSTYVLYADEVE